MLVGAVFSAAVTVDDLQPLTVVLVGLAFEYGETVQRDIDGLV